MLFPKRKGIAAVDAAGTTAGEATTSASAKQQSYPMLEYFIHPKHLARSLPLRSPQPQAPVSGSQGRRQSRFTNPKDALNREQEDAQVYVAIGRQPGS